MSDEVGGPAAVAAVRRFCEAWATGNVDHLAALLAPDILWHNVPIGVLHGRAAARRRIEAAFATAQRIEWQLLAVAITEDGLVMTERLDLLTFPGGDVRLPIMGVFRVGADGIRLWRDYFDAGRYADDLARCGVA